MCVTPATGYQTPSIVQVRWAENTENTQNSSCRGSNVFLILQCSTSQQCSTMLFITCNMTQILLSKIIILITQSISYQINLFCTFTIMSSDFLAFTTNIQGWANALSLSLFSLFCSFSLVLKERPLFSRSFALFKKSGRSFLSLCSLQKEQPRKKDRKK